MIRGTSFRSIDQPSEGLARILTSVNPANVKSFVPLREIKKPAGYTPIYTNPAVPFRRPKPFGITF